MKQIREDCRAYCISVPSTVDIIAPVSVRNVMGNTNSLLHQVVHAPYSFKAEDLTNGDEALNADCREFLKGFSSEQNIKMLCGVYRGICEGYAKAMRDLMREAGMRSVAMERVE